MAHSKLKKRWGLCIKAAANLSRPGKKISMAFQRTAWPVIPNANQAQCCDVSVYRIARLHEIVAHSQEMVVWNNRRMIKGRAVYVATSSSIAHASACCGPLSRGLI